MNSDKTNWYLRKPDGSEYGPITTSDLQRWAKQCRIVAGNGVSSDREEWIKVEDIPELEMDWIAHRLDGSEYGPFNIAATQELIDHKVLTEEVTLTHKTTKKSVTVQQVLNEEDLFAEADQQDQLQNDNEEQTLSEEALKEEEMYTRARTQESKKNKHMHSAPLHKSVPSSERPPTTPSDTPSPTTDTRQLDKLQSDLQKAKDDLTQIRKELKSTKQEMSEIIETLTEKDNQAQKALSIQQKNLEKLKQNQAKEADTNAIHYEALEAKLAESIQIANQAEDKLSRLESERSEAEHQSLQSVTELRKQTAFMKKNSITLQHELEKSRTIAGRRGRQLVIIITAIGIIAGIMLLTGKPGCRKNDIPKDPQPQNIPEIEETEQLPRSQRPYTDTANIQKPHSPKIPQSNNPISQQPALHSSQSDGEAHRSTPQFPKIMIEGVKIIKSGQTHSIHFDSGVFTTLTIPSASAKLQLKQIANILRPHMNNLKIVVEGCTDNTPMRKTATYNGNSALGLARAEAIKKLLISKGRLPGNAITARYAGEENTPYPNDTASNRKRNRTVVLKIVRK